MKAWLRDTIIGGVVLTVLVIGVIAGVSVLFADFDKSPQSRFKEIVTDSPSLRTTGTVMDITKDYMMFLNSSSDHHTSFLLEPLCHRVALVEGTKATISYYLRTTTVVRVDGKPLQPTVEPESCYCVYVENVVSYRNLGR